MFETISATALIAVCAAAVWFDLRERRIPNALTLGALAIAIVLRAPAGLDAVVDGLLGSGIAFGLALVFFLLGGLGGGDVKLLAAVGAFLGPDRLWPALFITAMVGGAMAVVTILRHGAVRQTALNLYTIVTTLRPRSFTGWKGPEHGSAVTLDTPGVLTVPYGVAIAAGAIAGWFLWG